MLPLGARRRKAGVECKLASLSGMQGPTLNHFGLRNHAPPGQNGQQAHQTAPSLLTQVKKDIPRREQHKTRPARAHREHQDHARGAHAPGAKAPDAARAVQ
jgi:hypothetical protein